MKRLLAIVLAAAMVASFLPGARADEGAVLGLQVTFAPDPIAERVHEMYTELIAVAEEAREIYRRVIERGDPGRIEPAIDELLDIVSRIEGIHGSLEKYAVEYPHLRELISPILIEAEEALRKIEGYIAEIRELIELPEIWTEPNGPFEAREGEELRFLIVAKSRSARSLELSRTINMPERAIPRILERSTFPEGGCKLVVEFSWEPEFGDAADSPYHIQFTIVTNAGVEASIDTEVIVDVGEQIISIELESVDFTLENVQMGEMKPILGPAGQLPKVINTGNVHVYFDIGYVPIRYTDDWPGPIQPGKKGQGLNRFVTKLDGRVIYPSQRLIAGEMSPGEAEELSLVFGAPTSITEDVEGIEVEYELRAYSQDPQDPRDYLID